MHALVSAEAAQSFLDAHLAALNGIPAAGGDFCALKESGNQVVIAVHTDDFLCHVLISFHIVAICGNLQGQHALAVLLRDLGLHIEIVHDADNIFIRNCDAEHAADAVDLDRHLAGLHAVAGIDVKVCGGNLAAAEFLDQVQRALHSHDSCVLVDALLKAGTGIGSLADASGSAADVVARELRGFKHN